MNHSTFQNLRLHDWIAQGKDRGKIRDVRTVMLAYCMDEREAMVWIADIVTGKTGEQDALIFMERALQYQH